jgi:hypothetical protein
MCTRHGLLKKTFISSTLSRNLGLFSAGTNYDFDYSFISLVMTRSDRKPNAKTGGEISRNLDREPSVLFLAKTEAFVARYF